MKCPKCGFENPEAAKFCVQCGVRMEGHELPLPMHFKFCAECGHKLETQPSIDFSRPNSYTPKFLAEKILTQRTFIKGERKLVTVMFADVANFTPLSEKLDPEEVHQIMDGCFRILLDQTHRYEGTINQFTGDGVMALFGAPVAHEDHARRACYAALSIQKALVPYGEELKRRYGAEFRMRIGLNSGPVIVGAIGDDLRMDYTAVGDTTNLAARMEHQAPPGSVLISVRTYRLVRDFFEFRALGKLQIKGKEEAQEVFELIREGDLATRFEAATARGLTKFIGRQKVLDEMESAYRQVCAGAGRGIEVVGEAGVGKSRLLLEFRDRLPKEEFSYHVGRCIRFGYAMTYLPLRQILKSCLGMTAAETNDVRTETLSPPLQDILGIKTEDERWENLEPKEKRARSFETVRDLLLQESLKRPLVVAVEDFHWIDRSSEEFLEYFIGWIEKARILMLILRRPEHTPMWGEKSLFKRIGIDRLTAEDSADLVNAVLKGCAVTPEVGEIIYRKAGGNPLFMEELTRTLLESHSIQEKDGKYVLTGSSSSLQVPETVEGIIASRLDRLEEKNKKTLQMAAAIGREFTLRVLQTVSRSDDLSEGLLHLQDLDFIHEKALLPEPEYVFNHDLTQDVSYNSLLHDRRKEIHERIGRAIEDLYPEKLKEFYEVLAAHYSKGQSLEKAAKYMRLSAEKALKSNSLWVALRLYKELLALLGQEPETDARKKEKIEVLVSMIPILRGLGFPEDPADILQEGARLCKGVEDKRRMAVIHAYAAMAFTYRGDAALGVDYLEQTYLKGLESQAFDIVSEVVVGLIPNYMLRGEFRKVIDVTSNVVRLFEQAHSNSPDFGMPVDLHIALLHNRGSAMGFLGDFPGGEEECEKAVSLSYDTGRAFSIGEAELSYGTLLILWGKGEQAISHLQQSIENYEKSQGTIWLPTAWSYLGLAHSLAGNGAKALECLENAIRMQVESGIPALLPLHHCHMSGVHLDHRNWEKAIFHAEEAVRLSQMNDDKHHETLSLVYQGVAEWKVRKVSPREAEERLVEAIERLQELGLRPWVAQGNLHLGDLLFEAGESEKAAKRVKNAESMFLEMGMNWWAERAALGLRLWA